MAYMTVTDSNGNATLTHAPQYFVTDLPGIPEHIDVLGILRYFGITPGMLVEYIMAMWPLFISSMPDEIYGFIVEEIEANSSIFRRPPDTERDDNYYFKFEALMEIIYRYSDHFKRVLIGQMDPKDENDQTRFFCTNAQYAGTVVLGVQKSYCL